MSKQYRIILQRDIRELKSILRVMNKMKNLRPIDKMRYKNLMNELEGRIATKVIESEEEKTPYWYKEK